MSAAGTPRAPAPPYVGEGPFSLWHFSEDPGLGRLEPRVTPEGDTDDEVVWAVDTRHAPLYWFPRDCPRGCIWASDSTTPEDRERFLGQTVASRVHVIESAWLGRLRSCDLFAYELPTATFRVHGEVGGYWTSPEPVDPLGRHVVGDLLERHAAAGFELRVTPSIWPFWRRVTASTLAFSGCRLRNAGTDATRG